MSELSAKAVAIECLGMTKHFGSFVALSDVSMRVEAGEFHAILGENGAGKSTLVKCLVGYHRPDNGQIMVDGREQPIRSPQDAHALGIGMVYQSFTLVPSMTVAENLIMARDHVPMVLDWGKERAELDQFMARMPFRVPLDKAIANLAAGEKQKTEILTQLYLQRRFIILDEPTSVLTPQEADEVLGTLREMAQAKLVTVLMITHKFREVMAFADRVSVLRRGERVGGGNVRDMSAAALGELMVGHRVGSSARAGSERIRSAPGAVRFAVHGCTVAADNGVDAVRNVSFEVRAGEIVGIAGVSGNGQRELVEALIGQRAMSKGDMRIDSRPYRATRKEMAAHRVFSLPEEPLRNACIGSFSVAENLALRSFDKAPIARGPWLLRSQMFSRARQLISEYKVKTLGAEAPIRTLSGGNVQRAVLARELSEDVSVLIVANPVFGLDFTAVAEIHARLLEARDRGAAILLVSEDLDELLEISDRMVVMFNGEIVHETLTNDAEVMRIGRAMAGHADAQISKAA